MPERPVLNLDIQDEQSPTNRGQRQSFLEGIIPTCRKLTKIAGDPLFVNSSSCVGARALAGLVRIGILLAIARAYGSVQFGQLSLVISMLEILRTFSDFGVDTISIRKFAQASDQRTAMLGGIVGAKLLMATCFYCIGAGALFAISRKPVELELGAIAGLSLFFGGALGSLLSYLQSSFSMSRVFRTTLWTSLVCAGFATIAILSRAFLVYVVVALPLADAVNLILLSRKLDARLRVRFSLSETIALLKESLPVGLTVSSVVLYFRLDNLFIFKFTGEAALGLYALCYRIVEPALLIPFAFSTTSYTFLSALEYQQAGARKVARILLRTMWPAFVFSSAVAGFALFTGRPLMIRFFPAYRAAYPIILVLVLTLSVRTVNAALVPVLNSRAKYSLLAKITALNLLFNLLFVIALVPKWGALGAAWAAFLTESFNTLMLGQSVVSSLMPIRRSLLARDLGLQ